MGCGSSRLLGDTDPSNHSTHAKPNRRPKFAKSHSSPRQDVGYAKLTARGKGGVKSSRVNRVKVDEDGEIWFY